MPADFSSLHAAALPSARNFARRLTGNQDDAEDLLQDAALRAWKAFHQYDPSRSFKAWFFQILYHKHVDRLRKAQAKKPLSLDQLMEDACRDIGPIAPESSDPLKAVLQREWRDLLLTDLRPSYREAVELIDEQGYSYEEVAAVMGCPLGTVRSRLHRGHLILRKRILTRA